VVSVGDRGSSACTGSARRDQFGWALFDFVDLQTGGYVGLIALGVGYSWLRDVMNTSATYGFTPAWTAGRTVHALHLAHQIRPIHVSFGCAMLVPFVGAGVLATGGNGYFFRQPDQYDHYSDRYYRATAYYWTAQLGLGLLWRQPTNSLVARHGPYLELITLVAHAAVALENPAVSSWSDAVATALGYRVVF
jgi:hypothetical protein